MFFAGVVKIRPERVVRLGDDGGEVNRLVTTSCGVFDFALEPSVSFGDLGDGVCEH